MGGRAGGLDAEDYVGTTLVKLKNVVGYPQQMVQRETSFALFVRHYRDCRISLSLAPRDRE
jgi:hypothetical protein